jgi:hypothetical protein
VRRQRLAADGDAAAADRIEADDGLGELGAAGAHQTKETEHFAGPGFERDVLELVGGGESIDLDDDVAARRTALAREQVFDAAADHVLDQRVRRMLGNRLGGYVPAIAEHRDGISDLEYLIDLVADVEHGDADAGQAPNDVEQQRDFGGRQ